jgi:hypothetical protein
VLRKIKEHGIKTEKDHALGYLIGIHADENGGITHTLREKKFAQAGTISICNLHADASEHPETQGFYTSHPKEPIKLFFGHHYTSKFEPKTLENGLISIISHLQRTVGKNKDIHILTPSKPPGVDVRTYISNFCLTKNLEWGMEKERPYPFFILRKNRTIEND